MKYGEKVKGEKGIYRKAPNVYVVVASMHCGRDKLTDTVNGDIHTARKRRNELRDDLLAKEKNRSLKVKTAGEEHLKTAAGETLSNAEPLAPLVIRSVSDALTFYKESYFKTTSRWKWGIGKYHFGVLKTEYGGVEIAGLNNERVDIFVNRLKKTITKKGNFFKPSGINPFIGTLKAALNHCKGLGKIPENPIADYPLLEVVKPKKRIVPQNIVKIIKKEYPKWALPMIIYKELVPCRYLELCDVTIDRVSDDFKKITVAKDKNGNERELPIPQALIPYFKKMRSLGCPWAFGRPEWKDKVLTWQKFHLNTMSRIFKKLRESHGWDSNIKFRMLRHSTVSQWLREYDINLVSDVAGANPETLREYYDLVPFEDKLNAVNSFARKCKIKLFKVASDTRVIPDLKKVV